MPKIYIDAPGAQVKIGNYEAGSIQVIGIFGNGANDKPIAADDLQLSGEGENVILTLPSQTYDSNNSPIGPTQYLVKFERSVSSGAQIVNDTKSLPQLNKLTLFCAMGDPCKDKLRPCYVVIPRFAPDPSMTLSLSADETTVDFSGNLNVDYCGGSQALYFIYYPEEDLVLSGVATP